MLEEGSKSMTQKKIVDHQANPGTCCCDIRRRRRRRQKMKQLLLGKMPSSKGVKNGEST